VLDEGKHDRDDQQRARLQGHGPQDPAPVWLRHGHKRISYLGRTGGEAIDPSVIAVAGPRVAYVRTFCGEGGCLLRVFVYDLKQRKEGLG
jgi:hypothetical protein